MKTAVIFDLDGVLFHREIVNYKSYRDLVGTYGQHLPIEAYIHDYSGKTAEENIKNMIEDWELPITEEEAKCFLKAREREYLRKGLSLKAGAKEVMTALKERGCKTALISLDTREWALEALKQHEIWQCFDGMIFAEEEKEASYIDLLCKACSALQEPPESCLAFMGNETGIRAAASLGVSTICIPDLKMLGLECRKMAVMQCGSLKEAFLKMQNQSVVSL